MHTDVISSIIDACSREDGTSLGYYLTTMDNKDTVAHVNPHDIQQDPRLRSDLKPVVEAFVTLNRAYQYQMQPVELFTHTDHLLRCLNRYADNKPNWVVKALSKVTKELITVAVHADKYIKNNPNSLGTRHIGDLEHEACLAKAARTVHNSLKLCLNDRNEDSRLSKKQDVYFFVGQELKIYFKLQNRDLAKTLEKVLGQQKTSLPSLHAIEKSHAVTYLYYSGVVYCGERDFVTAFNKFKLAFALCDARDKSHQEAILIYLIPLKFVVTKKYPNLQYIKKFNAVSTIYAGLLTAVLNGDLRKFDSEFTILEIFFLKKNLYFAIEELRNFVMLKLIKRIYLCNESHPHLGLNLITRGIEFSKYNTSNKDLSSRHVTSFSSDEAECLIANLIFKGYIKGYLSHTNGVLVLSKKDPFPRQVRSDPTQ